MSSIGRNTRNQKATKATRKGKQLRTAAKAMGYEVPRASRIHRTRSGAAPPNYENNSQSLLPIDPNMLTMQMHSVLTAIPEHPDAFERFSAMPLEAQLNEISQQIPLAGGSGQKGGGLMQDTQHLLKGAIRHFIKPAWTNIVNRGMAIADTGNTIVTNYLTKLRDILSHAGIGNGVSEQHLANLLYGLTVLATAYQTGVLAMFPHLMAQFITILQQCIHFFPAVIPSAAAMGSAALLAALYRYRELPMGIYGVFAAVSTPLFSAAWAVGDAEFQAANPNLGENMRAGFEFQKQEWMNTMAYYRTAGKATLDRIRDQMRPAVDFTQALITGWNQYVTASIEQAIRGGRLFTDDVNAVTDYIDFLRNIGAQDPEAQAAAEAQIADLLGPEGPQVDPQVLAGAMAMGVGLIEMEHGMEHGELNSGNEEHLEAVTEAAAALLALTIAPPPENPNPEADAIAQLLAAADLGPDLNARGGRARRRRHRKTAKKSHKKRHTKKHKRKTKKG